jgi:hypothetical protein
MSMIVLAVQASQYLPEGPKDIWDNRSRRRFAVEQRLFFLDHQDGGIIREMGINAQWEEIE